MLISDNMPYHLQLKGYVGGPDFSLQEVDRVLEENKDSHVSVLIDSTGGQFVTGVSIMNSLRNHGDVSVHFVGMNASAATIASLGATHISMDADAMYLVHKVMMPVGVWEMQNADDMAALIENLQKAHTDLCKLDANVATLYARKCKKGAEELLALMKEGGWLTAKEALDWGFVDEVTNLEEDSAPEMTEAMAAAMAAVGMPIPASVPLAGGENTSAFGKFLAAIASFFKPGQATATMEAAAPAPDPRVAELENQLAEASKKITELEARLDSEPAEEATQVVATPTADKNCDEPYAQYCKTGAEAKTLFDSLP